MSAMSDYLENKLGDLVLRGQTFTAPRLYAALFTAAPSDSGGGTEVTYTNYARADLGAAGLTIFNGSHGNTTGASSGTSGVFTNANTITFPAPGASGSSGPVTHFGLFDAASGGNLLFQGALTAQRTVDPNGSAPSYAAGALSIQFA